MKVPLTFFLLPLKLSRNNSIGNFHAITRLETLATQAMSA